MWKRKKIEEEQRNRKKSSENNDSGAYFQKTPEGTWKFKQNLNLIDLAGLGKKKNVNMDNEKENTIERKEETSNIPIMEGKKFHHPE